ncbi:hypothetical protein KCA24_07755 [Escherichia coli]|nr:hypothetical protein [Escherichia coli]
MQKIRPFVVTYFSWRLSAVVGFIRERNPTATLSRRMRPGDVAKCRPDKAFTPHPAFA